MWERINAVGFINRLKAGDEEALNFVIKSLGGPLIRDLKNMYGLQENDAEDILIKAWLKIYRSVGAFESKGAKLTTWIFKVVRNTALDHLRKQARLNRISREDESLDHEGHDRDCSLQYQPRFNFEPVEEIEESPLLLQLRHALESISEPARDILRMKQVMSLKEIAKVENVSEACVSMRYNRALKDLHLALESLYGNEGRGSPSSFNGTASLGSVATSERRRGGRDSVSTGRRRPKGN